MSNRKPDEILNFFMKMITDEQCIVIKPRKDHFRTVEREFLDGLRRIPSEIVCPPGRNPYSYVMGQPGTWMMIWVPEK